MVYYIKRSQSGPWFDLMWLYGFTKCIEIFTSLSTIVTAVSYFSSLNEGTIFLSGFVFVLIGVILASFLLTCYIVLEIDVKWFQFPLFLRCDPCHVIVAHHSFYLVEA